MCWYNYLGGQEVSVSVAGYEARLLFLRGTTKNYNLEATHSLEL
jgi:hypothetical protein